jgi:hypothetical protein
MHIHGQLPGAGTYSVGNAARAATAERAAETRKRLLRAGQSRPGSRPGLDGPDDLSPDEMALIGRWMGLRHSRVLTDDEYRATEFGRNGRDLDLD